MTGKQISDSLLELQKEYESLDEAERKIDHELNQIVSSHPNLEAKLQILKNKLPDIQLINRDVANLCNMIEFTSTLADSVSSKVRQLDLAKNRVDACISRVKDIIDLKICTDGVKEALAEENYETAAAHIHRYLTLDKTQLLKSSSVAVSDSNESNSLEQAFQLLQEAEAKLKAIVDEKYDEAVQTGDLPQAERFFKIFPLIGQHENGLEKFSKYLCAQIRESSHKSMDTITKAHLIGDDKKSAVIFADSLIMLFEVIAQIIEAHQPLVETYYGHGKMMPFVKNLQNECDKQVEKVFKELRNKRKIDYLISIIQRSHSGLLSEKIDPRELDTLLAEITLINARCELYLSFLRKRVFSDLEANYNSVETNEQLEKEKKDVDNFLTHCKLSCCIQELIGHYIVFEDYFMNENVSKAISMDYASKDNLTSSIVDDVFFILKKCLRRSLSSGSVDGFCAMLNHAVTLLESNYKDSLNQKLKQGYPSGFDITQAYNVIQTSFQQGKLQQSSEHIEKQRLTFLITLNNIEVTNGYIYTLKKLFEDETSKLYGSSNKQSYAKLNTCLTEMGNEAVRFKSLLDFGFNQLVTTAIKPRIKQFIDLYLSVNHKINEEEFLNYEANDPFIQNFIISVDSLISQFKESLTANNYDTLISATAFEISSSFEKIILKCTFTKFGGLQLDKEIRSLVNYLTTLTTWSIREKFSRLNQISSLLSLENLSELYDYWDSSVNITWRLAPNEARQILSLRAEFKADEIKKIKL